jgi:hypothetical protein
MTMNGSKRWHCRGVSKSWVQQRVVSSPAFGDALLREGIDTMLAGDVDTGIIRTFGPRGNPHARNLFGIIGYLQKQAGVELHVSQGPR